LSLPTETLSLSARAIRALTLVTSLSSDDTSSSSQSYGLAIRPLFLPKDELRAKALELRRASLALTLLYLASKYGEAVPTKETLKKSLLPPRWSLTNEINIDYANIFWEDIIIKLNQNHRDKVVPYTKFLYLLMIHKMKEGYGDRELTLYPTQVFSVNNWALKPNKPEEPSFIDYMMAIYVADMPVVFKAPKTFSKAESVSKGTKPGAKPGHKKLPTSSKQSFMSSSDKTKGNDASAVFTTEADPRKSAPSDFVPQQQGKGANSLTRQVEEDETSRTIKLEDLAKLVSSVHPSFKDLDSPEDDPIFVVDDSDEDEEADEVYATTNVEIKNTLWELPTEFVLLLVKVASFQAKLKTLDALPGLFQNVMKALNKFAQVLNFASSKARDQSVLSAGQVNTMPTEGEKNTNQEAEKESTKSGLNDDDETYVTGSMVKSSTTKKLKNFDFITEHGKHIHLTKEQINQQNKIDKEAKVEAAKQEGDVRKG
nr:hypothetical protein [Tanacetum cinerariifolium]